MDNYIEMNINLVAKPYVTSSQIWVSGFPLEKYGLIRPSQQKKKSKKMFSNTQIL